MPSAVMSGAVLVSEYFDNAVCGHRISRYYKKHAECLGASKSATRACESKPDLHNGLKIGLLYLRQDFNDVQTRPNHVRARHSVRAWVPCQANSLQMLKAQSKF